MSYPQTVVSYSVSVDGSGLTLINLRTADGRWNMLKPSSTELAQLYIDVLRNEKPVFFVASRGTLYTGNEPVGEDE